MGLKQGVLEYNAAPDKGLVFVRYKTPSFASYTMSRFMGVCTRAVVLQLLWGRWKSMSCLWRERHVGTVANAVSHIFVTRGEIFFCRCSSKIDC